MKIKCNIIRDLLPDYVEHILDDKVNYDVEEHLNSCKECQEYYNNMTFPLPNKQKVPSSVVNKRKKLIKNVLLYAFIIIGLFVAGFVAYTILSWGEKDKTTDIKDYNKYLGETGIHSESFLIESDIFPKTIPDSAKVEEFLYYYYNPWDPCYASYLVYTCNDEEYKKEIERLHSINSSTNYEVYGLTGFPDTLCAVNANSYYGIVYALTQESENRIIYVEITSCNYFNDIDYKKYINNKYLPYGFDMSHGNITEKKKE